MSLNFGLRCNKCFLSLKSMKIGNSPFSLTNCGHIFCQKCIQKVLDSSKCAECNSTGVQSLVLTDPLPGAVKNIFEPFLDICDRMIFAAKFQTTQVMVLDKRLEELEKKYYALKMAYWQQSKKYQELKINYTRELNKRKEYSMQNGPSPTPAQNYFGSNVFRPSSDTNNANIIHRQKLTQRNYHAPYDNDVYLTDSSTNSATTVQTAMNAMTPDGMFRIPNLRRVPRSTDISSQSTEASSKILGRGRNNMF